MTDPKSGASSLFVQAPPQLANQYEADRFLRAWLRRKLPADVLSDIEPDVRQMGEISAGELYELQLNDRLREPELTQWDAWGNRVDRIELTPLWKRCAEIAAQRGLIAIPYESRHGRYSRIHQFALVYLFHPSSDVYTCPLAMTDGAARTLKGAGNTALIERALPHLMARDPREFWTSGQWMTEATGGSDVGRSRTRAVREGERWRLYGKKWFTSAITSQMALTLARPEGNGPGGPGLAMFYVETHHDAGLPNHLRIERLKDKLGTRKVPTAELLLEGSWAELVCDTRNGTRHIEPMLVVTRTWNAVTSVAFMRRAVELAKSYARQREAFGSLLSEQPLHVDTLASLEAETRGAFLMAFELVEMLGRHEHGELDDEGRALMRLLTPLAKLFTAKQAVAVVSEAIEAFGGAGYVEDTGLPVLLRDTQVLPIWEGTTNVLSLDALLRGDLKSALTALEGRFERCVTGVSHSDLVPLARRSLDAVLSVQRWLGTHSAAPELQAGARRVALTLGRAWQLMLMVEQAQWQLDHDKDHTSLIAAKRFALPTIDVLANSELDDSRALLGC
jgi:alkylation response protein AidB-like acyl-CoA dehydrogenase